MGEARFDFEQKHQPMRPAFVAVFTDQAGQVQGGGIDGKAEFFARFPAGAGVRRFTDFRVQLAARRAPETTVRFVRAFQEQHLVLLVEAVKQCGDLVIFANRRIHGRIKGIT